MKFIGKGRKEMKKQFSTVLILLSFAVAAGAAEPPQAGFWDSLKSRIEKVTPRKKNPGTTAVGGVRSAKQQDADLYWKGKEVALEVDEDELSLFKQALRSAESGKRDVTIAAFEGFLAKYPNSRLKDDCLKALAQLKQEKQPALP